MVLPHKLWALREEIQKAEGQPRNAPPHPRSTLSPPPAQTHEVKNSGPVMKYQKGASRVQIH